MAQTISLHIDSIAAGGDGVGRSNGLVVFVPRTAPGEEVTARISGKGSFARGTLRTITRESDQRITPPCEHYTRDRCGGCQIQHLAYTAQIAAKQRIVRDAIERIGKRAIELPEVRESEKEWRYRVKLTLAMHRLPDGGWIAGLHRYDDPSAIFAFADCPITDERVVSTWRDVLAQSDLFPDTLVLRGSIRLTADGPVFVLTGGKHWAAAETLFEKLPALAAMWWENEDGARRTVGDRRSGESLHRPVASFAQINTGVAASLRTHVIDTVAMYSPRTVVDAYAGAGDTAVALAELGARVTAIELDGEAARWSALRLPEGSASLRARVEEVLPALLPVDAVLLNPPRAGVDPRVTETLETTMQKPAVVVYTSCNPATLARDIARLPGYRIASLLSFDMFPQTAHVETVCELVPAA